MYKTALSILAYATFCTLLAGCAGGSAGNGLPATGVGGAGSNGGAPTQKAIGVGVQVRIPAPSSNDSTRKPSYVSSATQSTSIVVTNGASTPSPAQVVNLTPSSPNCTNGPSGLTCTATVQALPGSDVFQMTMYSGTNANGNVLSSGSVAKTIAVNQTNNVTIVLGGVIAAVSVSVATPQMPLFSSQSLVLSAADASGETIVGNYDTPITLVPSSGLSVSSTLVTSSTAAASVTVSYNGTPASTQTIGASAGSANASATITPASGVRQYAIPPDANNEYGVTSIRPGQGSDGNMYLDAFTAGGECQDSAGYCAPTEIVQLNPSTGATATQTFPNNEEASDIFPAPDGSIWIAMEGDVGGLARMSSFGSTPVLMPIVYPTPNPEPSPAPISVPQYFGSAPNQGDLWFTDAPSLGAYSVDPNFQGSRVGYIPLTGPYTSGAITEYDVPANNAVMQYSYAAGNLIPGAPGNGMWFADYNGSIDSVTASGTFTTTQTPQEQALLATFPGGFQTYNSAIASTEPIFMALGNDGKGYFTQVNLRYQNGGYLNTVTSASPPAFSALNALPWYQPFDDVNDGDWVIFTEGSYNGSPDILNMFNTSTGKQVILPVSNATAQVVATGPDGSIWVGCGTGTYASPGFHPCVSRVLLAAAWSPFPSALTLFGTGSQNQQYLGIGETGSSGPFTAASNNTSIATVAPAGGGLDHDFIVTGVAAGSTSVTVTDASGRSSLVNVSVTTASGTVQTRSRAMLHTLLRENHQ